MRVRFERIASAAARKPLLTLGVDAVQVVYGPGTFLNRAVSAVDQQIQQLVSSSNRAIQKDASAAYKLALANHLTRKQASKEASGVAQLAYQQQVQQLEQLALESGITGPVRIDSTEFIRQVVFDPLRGANQPKARFSYLFPTAGSALIQVRLKPSLSSSAQAAAIADIRRVVHMPMFQLQHGGTYTVSG